MASPLLGSRTMTPIIEQELTGEPSVSEQPFRGSEQPISGFATGPDVVAKIARDFGEAIRAEGNIQVGFGTPMTLDNHKIIPVARVEIGFAGGPDGRRSSNGFAGTIGSLAKALRRGFAGGSGGINVVPIGFIHEDGDRVQYQAIPDGQSQTKGKKGM